MDQEIARIAGRQRGRIATRQLRALGLDHSSIAHRLARGRLHRVARGVYAVGHLHASSEAAWATAILSLGPGTVLRRRSAGAHWGIRPSASALIEVGNPRRQRPVAGLRIHHGQLPADEVTLHDGIPITIVPRTILDLAAVLTASQLERTMAEADIRRLTAPLSLPDLLDRYPGRRGAAKLRRILGRSDPGMTVIRSELEAAFLDFIAESGLSRPQLNRRIEARGHVFECDAVWPDAALIVELDGLAYHSGRRAAERDRRRDRALVAAGWTVVRVTWSQLESRRTSLTADLAELLGRHGEDRLRARRRR